MNEHPLLSTAGMIKAILDDRKTQTRRVPVGRYLKWKVGDTIWVREAWWDLGSVVKGKWDGRLAAHTVKPRYVATCPDPYIEGIGGVVQPVRCNWKESALYHATWRKRPSIHMPRWVARIFLEITGLGDERVQDISEKDALAEGVIVGSSAMGHTFTAKEHFKGLWDSINANRGYGWRKNPVVKVIEFKRIKDGTNRTRSDIEN